MKRPFIYLLVISIISSGCYKRVETPKEQLTNHSSFKANTVTYFAPEESKVKSVEMSSFRIENQKLIGEVRGVHGTDLKTIPLDNVDRVERKELSTGKTIAAIIGGLAGAALLTVLIGIILVGNCDCSSS